MIEDALPEDPWFCNVCQSSRQPPPPSSELSGAFGSLLFKLNEKNPSAFQLPLDVRESFEGVKTGAEGEYEDIVPPKSRSVVVVYVMTYQLICEIGQTVQAGKNNLITSGQEMPKEI